MENKRTKSWPKLNTPGELGLHLQAILHLKNEGPVDDVCLAIFLKQFWDMRIYMYTYLQDTIEPTSLHSNCYTAAL